MRYIAELIDWGVKHRAALFIWGLLGTGASALGIFLFCESQAGKLLAGSYQLMGLGVTFWQLGEQRTVLGAKSARELIRDWWSSMPAYRKKPVTGRVVGAELSMSWGVASGQVRPKRSGTVEEQLDQLWAYVAASDAQIATLEQKLHEHKREALDAVEVAHQQLSSRLDGLRETVTEAVAADPFPVMFGLWLVAIGTVLQLFVELSAHQ